MQNGPICNSEILAGIIVIDPKLLCNPVKISQLQIGRYIYSMGLIVKQFIPMYNSTLSIHDPSAFWHNNNPLVA